jgi:CheY-like chemotaxis protein
MPKKDPEISNWTVLIVDDEPDNIGVAQKILTFYGATVHTAVNGAEGLKVLKTVTPTFILLDISMPVMDGWEMLKHLRADERIARLPVIAVTAFAMTGDRERILEAGFNGYISKPFSLLTFVDNIKDVVRQANILPSA